MSAVGRGRRRQEHGASLHSPGAQVRGPLIGFDPDDPILSANCLQTLAFKTVGGASHTYHSIASKDAAQSAVTLYIRLLWLAGVYVLTSSFHEQTSSTTHPAETHRIISLLVRPGTKEHSNKYWAHMIHHAWLLLALQ